MTDLSWVFCALFVICAPVEWWATHTDRMRVRYVTKPLSVALLIGVAISADPSVPGAIRNWMVAGLVLSLAGDVFLLLSEKWFIAGLGSFLLGHVAYIVGLQMGRTSLAWTLVGLVVVVVAAAVYGRAMLARVDLDQHRGMIGPVIAYIVVISAMVTSAFGTAAVLAVLGAGSFYASDATLAWNRFAGKHRWGPVTVMVTYLLGQAGLVAWVVTG